MAQSRSKRSQTRNYRNEYDSYQGTPKQIRNRSARNKARRNYEERFGNLPSNLDVDHMVPIVKGGSNDLSNTRDRPRSRNRSFRRTSQAGMK